MRGWRSIWAKVSVVSAACVVLGLGGLRCSCRTARSLTLTLDEGVKTCGFAGDRAAALPRSGSERTFPRTELTFRAGGRVVFSGPVESVDCYRNAEEGWGRAGGDFIQVVLPDARLMETVARWRRIYRQLGAGEEDLRSLDEWTAEVTRTERAGNTSRDLWLQGTFSIPGTRIGVYTQSIPTSSAVPPVYGSHFTIFWEAPR